MRSALAGTGGVAKRDEPRCGATWNGLPLFAK